VAAILRNIVEQHAEEAAFLWLLRDRAVDAPHYALRHLARLDERVEAHVDGLRVAGEPGYEIALEQLAAHQEPGEVFAAGVLALESGDPARIDPLVDLIEEVPEARRGLAGAIGWCAPERLKPTVRPWLDSARPLERWLGLVACSLHRADPASRLGRFFSDSSTLVRARALRLVGELGRADLGPELRTTLEREPDPDCRFWAAWSAALTGERGPAAPVLMTEVETSGPHRQRALEVAVRIMAPAEAKAWLSRLNGDPAHARTVVTATGYLGDPVAVPWLISRMAIPDLARLAGESFSLITGVDLAYDDLETDAPADFQSGPTDEPSDTNVDLDPDDNLPWPDPALIQPWWQTNAARLGAGTRHLLGRPIDEAACQHALTHGFQRQRRATAHELALARHDASLFDCRRVGLAHQGIPEP
jgi:uncharacterized protein (TIGR02270 family)